jgi:hypothetical protein
MATIRAIETVFGGYRFRSRLEARWAVFLTTLGVPFQYEPEGFKIGRLRYLPDFYLPEAFGWIEAKPLAPDERELEKAIGFASKAETPIAIFAGEPWPWKHDIIVCDIAGVMTVKNAVLAQCSKCGRIEALSSSDDGRHWHGKLDFALKRSRPTGRALPCAHDYCWQFPNWYGGDARRSLDHAYLAARQARFEFGEQGNG